MGRTRVRWALGLVGLALVASVSPSVAADDQPPVTIADEVTLLPGGSRTIDVLRNDSDDLGQQALCRARGTQDVDAAVDRGRLYLNVPTSQPGDYQVQYQACDYDYLSVGTVTVHAVAPQAVTVERVVDLPGVLRATNPNPVRVLVLWARPRSEHLGGRLTVKPGASQDFTVDRRRIVWVALDPSSHWEDGSLLGYGQVGNIALPASTADRLVELWRSTTSRARTGAPADGSWPADPTTVQPPVARTDTIHWWSGSWDRVPVTRNDVDPQGQVIDVCRLAPEASTPSITSALTPSVMDGQLDLGTARGAEGTWELPYYICNDGRLAPALLRVVVRPAKPLEVRRVARDPRLVRVHNPNDERATYILGHYASYGRVAAHATRVVRAPLGVRHWEGAIGPHYGYAGSGRIVTD